MNLSMLFETVNQIHTDIISDNNYANELRIGNKKASKISIKLDSKSKSEKKEEIKQKTTKKHKKTQEKSKKSDKQSKKTDQDSIIEIDEFTESNEEGLDINLGFEPNNNYNDAIGIKQYQQLLDQYKKFLDTYLKDSNNAVKASYAYSSQEDNRERNFEWGQEVVTYSEIKESVRKIKMNLLMGGWHNGVSQDEKDRYKFWKYVSKFNKVMAEVIETSVGSGG